jgi:hypothetical protein
MVPQWQQCDRCISAGDEQEYGILVDRPENGLDPLLPHAVIVGRRQKGDEHQSAVDGDGRRLQRVRLPPGSRDKVHQSHSACRCTAALDQSARNFFRGVAVPAQPGSP